MTNRFFLIPALAAALLISVASCKHSEEAATDEAVETVEEAAASENFTVTLDVNDTLLEDDASAAPDSTAKKRFFANAAGKIKGLFKSSKKESAESLAALEAAPESLMESVTEDAPEELQEEEQPAEKQKARKEKKVKQKKEKQPKEARIKEPKEKKPRKEKTVKEEPQPEEEVQEVKPIEVKLDTLESGSVWNSISPMDLTMNPVKNFAQDWMALVVGKNDKEHNSMTIAWGTIGQLWNKPVVIVYVSEDRYTKHLLDAAATFSVIGFPDKKKYRDALLYIGSHSQKDEPDKTENAGLTIEYTKNGTPIIAEGNLAIECRKIYEDAFDIDKIPSDVRNGMYQETGIHHMYIGEIVSVLQKN